MQITVFPARNGLETCCVVAITEDDDTPILDPVTGRLSADAFTERPDIHSGLRQAKRMSIKYNTPRASFSMIEVLRDKRIKCPFCGISTWDKDYSRFMRDHDRPDGRRCRKAAESVKEKP